MKIEKLWYNEEKYWVVLEFDKYKDVDLYQRIKLTNLFKKQEV